jgi:hypothetical protein
MDTPEVVERNPLFKTYRVSDELLERIAWQENWWSGAQMMARELIELRAKLSPK